MKVPPPRSAAPGHMPLPALPHVTALVVTTNSVAQFVILNVTAEIVAQVRLTIASVHPEL